MGNTFSFCKTEAPVMAKSESETMKALTFTGYSKDLSTVALTDVPSLKDVELGPNEVSIEVKAFSLSNIDKLIALGITKDILPLKHFPRVLGTEMAGVVLRVGSAVKKVKIGDSVCGLVGNNANEKHSGSAAQYCIGEEEKLVKFETSKISYAEAAALTLSGPTALQALRSGNVGVGSKVFITNGAGSVGQMALQYAKLMGSAKVGATASHGDGSEISKQMGADFTVDYKKNNFADLPEVSDYDYLLDMTDEIDKGMKILKSGGKATTIVGIPTVASLTKAGLAPKFPLTFFLNYVLYPKHRDAMAKQHGVTWENLWTNQLAENGLEEVVRDAEAKKIKVTVSEVFKIGETMDAFNKIGKVKGNLIISP